MSDSPMRFERVLSMLAEEKNQKEKETENVNRTYERRG